MRHDASTMKRERGLVSGADPVLFSNLRSAAASTKRQQVAPTPLLKIDRRLLRVLDDLGLGHFKDKLTAQTFAL